MNISSITLLTNAILKNDIIVVNKKFGISIPFNYLTTETFNFTKLIR